MKNKKNEIKLQNQEKILIETEEEKFLKKLSLEQKIGQLFMIGFDKKTLTSDFKDLLKTIHPGGIILFSRNIQDENQLKNLTKDLQKVSLEDTGLPLFIALDQEGGLVQRIKWIGDTISQAEIKNNEQAYQIGLKRGTALKNLGINLNLAPVLDITSKTDFIHNRSFQKDPETTGELAKYLILGQKDSGILTAIKHFPGYGGISFNPELIKIPILPKIPEISQFQKAMEAKPELIMTTNIIYSDIDEQLPFALSTKGIRFLKKTIKNDYIIISDDLSSKVLNENLLSDNQVVLAKQAGTDILLVAGWKQAYQDQINAFNILLKAVQEGKITEKQIDNSILKILKLKLKLARQLPIQQIEQKNKSIEPKDNQEEQKPTDLIELPNLKNDNFQLTILEKLLDWGYEPASNRIIDTIIIHSSYDALGNNPYNVDGVIYEYKLYNVSPHYLIDRKGNIFRLVKDENIAYHAGSGKMPDGRININSFSIGIEIINTELDGPNELQYQSLTNLIKFLKSKYEIKNILGHNNIMPEKKTDPWNFDWQKFNKMLQN